MDVGGSSTRVMKQCNVAIVIGLMCRNWILAAINSQSAFRCDKTRLNAPSTSCDAIPQQQQQRTGHYQTRPLSISPASTPGDYACAVAAYFARRHTPAHRSETSQQRRAVKCWAQLSHAAGQSGVMLRALLCYTRSGRTHGRLLFVPLLHIQIANFNRGVEKKVSIHTCRLSARQMGSVLSQCIGSGLSNGVSLYPSV